MTKYITHRTRDVTEIAPTQCTCTHVPHTHLHPCTHTRKIHRAGVVSMGWIWTPHYILWQTINMYIILDWHLFHGAVWKCEMCASRFTVLCRSKAIPHWYFDSYLKQQHHFNLKDVIMSASNATQRRWVTYGGGYFACMHFNILSHASVLLKVSWRLCASQGHPRQSPSCQLLVILVQMKRKWLQKLWSRAK